MWISPHCNLMASKIAGVPEQALLLGKGARSATRRINSRPPQMIKLRPLVERDYTAVQTLHRAVGWPARSLEGWRWLHANPARRETTAPAAWVLEGSDGSVQGHLGNLVQRFHCGEELLHGVTGFNIIVQPQARGNAYRLLEAFNQQDGMFAHWTFNANPLSAPLYARQGMLPWPPPTAGLKLSWPLRPFTLAVGRVLKAAHSRSAGWVGGLGERLLDGRDYSSERVELPRDVRWISSFSDDSPYAWFWQALKAESRMVSDRSPDIMRWRLRDPDLTMEPVTLGVYRGGGLVGFALALFSKGNAIEPVVLEIVDLEALDGHEKAIGALMSGLLAVARRKGAAKLRLSVVSPRNLVRLGRYARIARREGGWGHCHVRFAGEAPTSWSPTPWDGDYGFCLRPVPALQRRRGLPAPAGAGPFAKATGNGC